MATPADAIQNVNAGHVYLKPNIRGAFSLLSQQVTNKYTYSPGTLIISLDFVTETAYDPDNKPKYKLVFKNGNFIEAEITEAFAGGLLTSASVKKTYNEVGTDGQTVVNTYNLGSTSLSATRDVGGGEISVVTAYEWALTYWAQAGYNIYETIIQKSWAGGNYTPYIGNSNSEIIKGWSISQMREQHLIDFLAGDTSEGTTYPGDESDTGGGSGSFYGQNDVIGVPSLPSIQAIDFGFNSIYNPSSADMIAISSWLWSDDFEQNILKNFTSPFENILAIAIVPIGISATNANFKIGNVTNTNITLPKVDTQYIEIDCGYIDVQEYWGSFLDYNATYTIYLPFIGYRSIKPDDMVGGQIGVIYHVDLLSGLCVCFIWTNKDGINHVLYTYTGSIFYNIAISGANYMSMYNQQLQATANGINNFVGSLGSIASNAVQGNLFGVASGFSSMLTGQALAQRQYDTAKPDYGRGGTNGGNAGIFSIRYPYLIQSLPIGQAPKNYAQLQGIPSQIHFKLTDLVGKGYTEVGAIVVDTLSTCTDEEKTEIINILRGGVIL